MRSLLVSLVAALLVFSSGPVAADELAIEVVVSPNVINLASASTVVTVHTNIAYGAVAGATVTLSGVAIDWWKADNQGCFVAKFRAQDVKDILVDYVGQQVTLNLCGETKTGVEFSGSDDVGVINVKPK